jgi:prepilin-type N-terminal cleavage/methylation domain-containing protein
MRRSNRQHGFTLVEIMITVAIIGILAAIAIPAFSNYQNRSRRAEAFANLGAIAKLEKSYFSEYSVYVAVPVSQPGGGNPVTKRPWTALADAAFGTVGFHPDGDVLYDYDVNVDAAQCPRLDCFTATAYGDADADGNLALIMYAQPDTNGAVTFLAYAAFGIRSTERPARTNEVASTTWQTYQAGTRQESLAAGALLR